MKTSGGRLVAALPFALAIWVSCNLALLAGASGADWEPTRVADATYYEEQDQAVSWSGSWSTKALAPASGGSARLAMDAGAQASFRFSGPGVTWIGYRDEWCGIAKVSLDGELQATLDTYASPAAARAVLYTVSGLERGAHILSIEATGTHAAASAGSWVWVDAFALTPQPSQRAVAPDFIPAHRSPASGSRAARPPRSRRSGHPTRLEQDDRAVSWSGSWSSNQLPAHSGGSARLSMEASSRVSLVFRGTGVSWIGYRDEWSGIADVLLDGRLRASVDTYAPTGRAQSALYSIEGLPEGTHTLTIQPTARRRPASGGSWIWVDAFSIAR